MAFECLEPDGVEISQQDTGLSRRPKATLAARGHEKRSLRWPRALDRGSLGPGLGEGLGDRRGSENRDNVGQHRRLHILRLPVGEQLEQARVRLRRTCPEPIQRPRRSDPPAANCSSATLRAGSNGQLIERGFFVRWRCRERRIENTAIVGDFEPALLRVRARWRWPACHLAVEPRVQDAARTLAISGRWF